jgi:hypothetical protein
MATNGAALAVAARAALRPPWTSPLAGVLQWACHENVLRTLKYCSVYCAIIWGCTLTKDCTTSVHLRYAGPRTVHYVVWSHHLVTM